jgi:DNA invertase Pin-like site-specific DNA recombinase
LTALVERVASNCVRTVLVERADRLARDLVEGELILRELRQAGVRVIEAEAGTDRTREAANRARPDAAQGGAVRGAAAVRGADWRG